MDHKYRVRITLTRSKYVYMSLPMDLDDALDYARTLLLNGQEAIEVVRDRVVPATGPVEF